MAYKGHGTLHEMRTLLVVGYSMKEVLSFAPQYYGCKKSFANVNGYPSRRKMSLLAQLIIIGYPECLIYEVTGFTPSYVERLLHPETHFLGETPHEKPVPTVPILAVRNRVH